MNAVVAIERKINSTRFRDLPVGRWVKRGGFYGLGVSVLLGPLVFLVWLLSAPLQAIWISPGTYFSSLVVALLVMAFLCTLVGAAVSVLVMGVFRPIWVALFRSIDDWEQEYGDRRPRPGAVG